MTILDKIIAHKKKEVESCKELTDIASLQKSPLYSRPSYSLKQFVMDNSKTGIIAEFKRQSPSKGIINDKVSVEDVTRAYSKFGASGLSVLTDFNFFGGSIDDLIKARSINNIPILRKDFIVDVYQIEEAKAHGADVILLIAAVLEKKELQGLYSHANAIGLEVLTEVHTQEELDKVGSSADLVGINNRNLKTFEVDIENSIALAQQLPSDMPKIAESGIHSVDTIDTLKGHGFNGFLIGENFMKTNNPAKAFEEFVQHL